MLQPQTSATASNISEQTVATDTTIGSDANLLPANSAGSINKVSIYSQVNDLSYPSPTQKITILRNYQNNLSLSLFMQNGIDLPTTDTPDVDDAGVEEITMNSTETLPKENIQDHNIRNADIDKRHIPNKEKIPIGFFYDVKRGLEVILSE